MNKLEADHRKDLEEQNEIFNKKETDEQKNKSESKNESPLNKSKSKKIDRKCHFFEKGFCKKGNVCDFLHPAEICKQFSKYGQCPQGIQCPLRHPLRICMNYMEGRCHNGDNCVLQHPLNRSPPRPTFAPPPPPTSYSLLVIPGHFLRDIRHLLMLHTVRMFSVTNHIARPPDQQPISRVFGKTCRGTEAAKKIP